MPAHQWEALDGLRFWADGGRFSLVAGVYGNNRGAAVVNNAQVPECKLTLNLVDEELPDANHFFVKGETLEDCRGIFVALIELGVIAPTQDVVTYGRGCAAEVWRLAPSDHQPVAVLCRVCWARWREQYIAGDSVKRMA
jgi:hypothetical protein